MEHLRISQNSSEQGGCYGLDIRTCGFSGMGTPHFLLLLRKVDPSSCFDFRKPGPTLASETEADIGTSELVVFFPAKGWRRTATPIKLWRSQLEAVKHFGRNRVAPLLAKHLTKETLKALGLVEAGYELHIGPLLRRVHQGYSHLY